MRLVIFGVIAFVLGLGGSTGVMVFTAPAHSRLADSLAVVRAHADSTKAHGAETVALAHSPVPVPVTPKPDTATAHAAPIVAEPAAEGGHAPVVTHVPPAPVAAAAAAPAHATNEPDAERYKQVGSILLNMKPAEAAKVIAYLNDDQVEGLLRSMSPRQAAGVLGQLPPERAAALSRRLLIPAPKEAQP